MSRKFSVPDCGAYSHRLRPWRHRIQPPFIPLGWTTVYPCAVDVPSRVLANVITTQYTDNTPASCIERCDAANYTYAGVEYSNECHCGTGLVGTPKAAPTTDCNMACTGDSSLSCGGSFRIQIYKSPALAPGGWGLQGCFVDTPLLPAFSAAVHTTFASNVDLVEQCINYCTHIGMPFAGVENASDCQCSLGLTAGVTGVPESECNATCPLPPGEGSLFCGGVERLIVYKYQG
ncbi:hypothetical protein V8D89_003903 [Ganoderma adspersum]